VADFFLCNRRLGMKKGDTRVWVRGDTITLVWKDKNDIRMLTNMHASPVEGNFCNEHGKFIKPAVVVDYNINMG
jgi:hypothetical protein